MVGQASRCFPCPLSLTVLLAYGVPQSSGRFARTIPAVETTVLPAAKLRQLESTVSNLNQNESTFLTLRDVRKRVRSMLPKAGGAEVLREMLHLDRNGAVPEAELGSLLIDRLPLQLSAKERNAIVSVLRGTHGVMGADGISVRKLCEILSGDGHSVDPFGPLHKDEHLYTKFMYEIKSADSKRRFASVSRFVRRISPHGHGIATGCAPTLIFADSTRPTEFGCVSRHTLEPPLGRSHDCPLQSRVCCTALQRAQNQALDRRETMARGQESVPAPPVCRPKQSQANALMLALQRASPGGIPASWRIAAASVRSAATLRPRRATGMSPSAKSGRLSHSTTSDCRRTSCGTSAAAGRTTRTSST